MNNARCGTFYGYTNGCRCTRCKRANAEHARLSVGSGTFGIKIGAKWAALSVDFLHKDSMRKWRDL